MMLLIWRGWGILILVPAAICGTLVRLGINAVMQDARFFEAHAWPKLLASGTAAAVCWPIGRYMNRPKLYPLFDEDPDERATVREVFGETPLVFLESFDLSRAQRVQIQALIEEDRRLDGDDPFEDPQREELEQRQDWLWKDIRRRILKLLTPEQLVRWEDFADSPMSLKIPVPGRHSLFFIPVQYWWIVFLVLGVMAAFK
jgi:hypothetical protein